MKLWLEEASLERKKEALEYIEEMNKYNSYIAGVSNLEKASNYEEWLEGLNIMKNEETCPENRCPGIQYYLMKEEGNKEKLVGMINLRWNLNEWLLMYGGHIGYSVRPTERQNGYNKVSLYLCLLKAKELGLEEVLLTANEKNIGSIKTILSLGGILENKVKKESEVMGRYWINVEKATKENEKIYKKYMK